MREILFRGKRQDNGKWVEGDLYQYGDMRVIGRRSDDGRITTYSVIPETVSEFAGLMDKNGKKIFEGDILECDPGCVDHCRGYVKYGEWNCSCCYMVIGNIWDTPNLLGGETQEGPDR